MNYSKISTLIILLILSFTKIHGQSDTDNRKTNWKYFKEYNNEQKNIIRTHWQQYFQDDIYKKLAPSIDMFPIKFDSYGSLYPDLGLFKDFTEKDFNPHGWSDFDNQTYSMLDIFKNSKEKLIKAIENLNDKKDKEFYKKILNNEISLSNDALFYDPWDEYHTKKINAALNTKIAAKEKMGKKVRVVFFIHGYNVPYSLANVQAIELIKLLAKGNIDTSSIILVPIFWPSHNGKDCLIEDSSHFSTENFTKLNNGGPKNGIGFWYYSNRAYFAGIGLRKLINGITSSNVDLLIFSHSLGATIATTALINTYSKLDTKFQKEKNRAKNANEFFKSCKEKLKTEPTNYSLVYEMIKEPLPTKKVKVFLSAAAIPGYNTFYDMDPSCESKWRFYIPINSEDEMLNKDILPLGIGNPFFFGVTTLGLNYNDDAENTQKEFFKNPKNLDYCPVSQNKDHDILTYMRQTGYVDYVVKFFNEK